MKVKNIGMGINHPKKSCNDCKCPFHGQVKVRGRTFTGTIISAIMQKTATIEFVRRVKIRKYERYAKQKTRIKAHNSPCIQAEEGDIVKIMETRPLSKTVNFVIVERIGKEGGYIQRKEFLEEGKKRKELTDKPKDLNNKISNNETEQ